STERGDQTDCVELRAVAHECDALSIRRPGWSVLPRLVPREPDCGAAVHQADVHVVVVFTLAVPRERNLVAVRRKRRVDLTAAVTREWASSEGCRMLRRAPREERCAGGCQSGAEHDC